MEAIDGRASGPPTAPAGPLPPSRAGRPIGWRALVAAAGATMLAGLVVFAAIRLTGPDRLPGIDENAVGRIDSARSAVVSQYAVGHDPGAMAVGAGSVWTANTSDGTVSRIDLERDHVATIDVGQDVTGLAYGAGALWVAGGNRALTRIDPGRNKVARRIDVGNGPRGVAVGFDAAWVTLGVDGRLARIDLTTGRHRSIPIPDPGAIAAGAGAIWVASESAGTVMRVEPRSAAVVQPIRVGNAPSAIAVGHGAVWVANRDDGTVYRIDPAANTVTDAIRVGPEPTALAVTPDGVWVGSAGDATVTRIDPTTRQPRERIAVRSSPQGMAALGDVVWVAAGPSPQSHRGGTLRVMLDHVGVDPVTAGYDPTVIPLVTLVYDGLVGYRRIGGAAGNELVGDLATRVPDPSADRRSYVFTLRPGLRYSDGTPVRAGDFRASMERMLRTVGREFPFYDSIAGAVRCERDPRRCDLRRGIVTDERARTITIHLAHPDANLIWYLAVPLAAIVGPERPVPATARVPLGTGPYRVARFDKRRGPLLVRNPRFRA
jgi:peptide/nickel transport system substrate-binding protein